MIILEKELGLSEVQVSQSDKTDDDFCPELEIENEKKQATSKQHYKYSPSIPKSKDEDMPFRYRYIRDGMRKMHP